MDNYSNRHPIIQKCTSYIAIEATKVSHIFSTICDLPIQAKLNMLFTRSHSSDSIHLTPQHFSILFIGDISLAPNISFFCRTRKFAGSILKDIKIYLTDSICCVLKFLLTDLFKQNLTLFNSTTICHSIFYIQKPKLIHIKFLIHALKFLQIDLYLE